MLRFEMKAKSRKELATRLGELLGIKPHYTAAPRMVYEVGDWTIERDGALTVEEKKVDDAVLQTLEAEGLIQLPKKENKPEPEQLAVVISLPLEGHTGNTVRNLINLFYQRANLINKATGSHFYVDIDLVNALKNTDELTVDAVREILAEHQDELTGLEIKEDKISFTGFPSYADSDSLKAFMELASRMNQQALSQKRVYPKTVNDESEKYALRIWMTRLGMNGPKYKTTRNILLKNLSGYASFRNREEAEKFFTAQKAKRNHAKEVKE